MANHVGDIHPNILRGDPLERLVDMSLGELLLMMLKTHGENVILTDPFSHEEFQANILLAKGIQLAKWLKSQNIGLGDIVSVNSENRIEFAVTVLATFFVAATFAPLNPDYTPTELKHVLDLSKPKIIFCSENTIKKMTAIKPKHSYIKTLVGFGKDKHPNVFSYEDIIQGVTEVDEEFEAPEIDVKQTVATILCSSGTTGLPKGVMCTHDNMGAYIDVARTQLLDLALNEDPSDAMMGLTPFFHSFGFMLMFLNIIRGKKMVVIRKFNLKLFLESIIKYNIRRLIVPPPVLLILLKNPMVKNYDLSGLQEIRSGAAALGKDMEKELKQRFKVKTVSQSYGMTETTLGVLLNIGDLGVKIGSVGKVVAGMMVKVINEDAEPLGPYKEGELCFKGPLIMKGYVGDPKATADILDKDGWLRTGDVAYYDDDKYFFIVDRIKELIKYKGFQVAPAELEALLLTHPSIQDAAVIGLPDEDAGELPLAYVVKREGKDVTEKEVKKFVADTLSHQKQLRGGVIFIDEIPKNPTGKILRRVLRENAKSSIKIKAKL